MRSIPLASVPADALGIEVGPHRDGAAYGWFFRLVLPAPFRDWDGPYDTHEAAQAAALRYLLHLAHDGWAAERGTFAADDEPVYAAPV